MIGRSAAVVMRPVMARGVMMRGPVPARVATAERLCPQILVHHHAAVFVPHDLPVSHRVALADRPLGEVLVRGVALRAASMMHAPMVMDPRAAMQLDMPMAVRTAAVAGVMFARRNGRIVRKRRELG